MQAWAKYANELILVIHLNSLLRFPTRVRHCVRTIDMPRASRASSSFDLVEVSVAVPLENAG